MIIENIDLIEEFNLQLDSFLKRAFGDVHCNDGPRASLIRAESSNTLYAVRNRGSREELNIIDVEAKRIAEEIDPTIHITFV